MKLQLGTSMPSKKREESIPSLRPTGPRHARSRRWTRGVGRPN